jgi:general secretion pathway protein E
MTDTSFTIALKEVADLSDDQLAEAMALESEHGMAVGHQLFKKKVITELQFLETLAKIYRYPFWADLPLDQIKTDFAEKVPIQFLKKHTMVPLVRKESADGEDESREDSYIIAINSPGSFQAVDDLAGMLGISSAHTVLSTRQSILSAINLCYDTNRDSDSAAQLVQDMEEDSGAILNAIEDTADLLDDTSDAPIIKLVNHILTQSIKSKASDIHIEPFQTGFKVRNRVDGILYDLLTPPKWIQAALISRIKVMAKMNIAEKRLPQDGRFEVRIGDQEIDVRVSTIPTSFGERVVMRLLNKSGAILVMSELGAAPEKLLQLNRLVQSPNGIILVTGPTGSGKTTSLYAILASINTPDINIITIEDPVEYQLKGISQIQVNPKIDLTFARGLRSIVRQDPDVVLVGEIRDKETADIAVQSALTGHLVFSTLHTNDSASAITRLVDIGVEPFLISSSVIAVVAQRLVRVLCRQCREPYVPDTETLKSINVSPSLFQGKTIYRPKGCDACLQKGYSGRTAIFEILELDSDLKTVILKTHDSNQIMATAVRKGMMSLMQDGFRLVLKGITSIEEVLRVAHR